MNILKVKNSQMANNKQVKGDLELEIMFLKHLLFICKLLPVEKSVNC